MIEEKEAQAEEIIFESMQDPVGGCTGMMSAFLLCIALVSVALIVLLILGGAI